MRASPDLMLSGVRKLVSEGHSAMANASQYGRLCKEKCSVMFFSIAANCARKAISSLMAWRFALVLTILMMADIVRPADAHSWYPRECCSNQDCMMADAIEADGRGGRSVLVGQVRIPVPDGTQPRPSPDGRIHACFRSWAGDLNGLQTFSLICLFIPAAA